MGFAVVVVFKLHGHEAFQSTVTNSARLFGCTGSRRHDDFSAESPHVLNAQRIHILRRDYDAPEPEFGVIMAQGHAAVAACRLNDNAPAGSSPRRMAAVIICKAERSFKLPPGL